MSVRVCVCAPPPRQAQGLSLQCLSSARGDVVRAAETLRREMAGSEGTNERLNRGFNARIMAVSVTVTRHCHPVPIPSTPTSWPCHRHYHPVPIPVPSMSASWPSVSPSTRHPVPIPLGPCPIPVLSPLMVSGSPLMLSPSLSLSPSH